MTQMRSVRSRASAQAVQLHLAPELDQDVSHSSTQGRTAGVVITPVSVWFRSLI